MRKMHAFTLKLDDKLFEKIEAARGELIKADYIRDILTAHFEEIEVNPNENRRFLKDEVNNLVGEIKNLKGDINHLDQIIKVMEERVKDLQTSNGFFISQIQLLTEQKKLSEPKKRLWFEFWK
jgi:hypothetical protein